MAKNSGSTRNGSRSGTETSSSNAILESLRHTWAITAQADVYRITERPVTAAEKRWLGDAQERAREVMQNVVDRLAKIEKVRDMRDNERAMQQEIYSLRADFYSQMSLMENNRNFVTGRAKRTADSAISEISYLINELDQFRNKIETGQIAQRIEEHLIQNNLW